MAETDFYAISRTTGKNATIGEVDDVMRRTQYGRRRIADGDISYVTNEGEVILQGNVEQDAFIMIFPDGRNNIEANKNHTHLKSKLSDILIGHELTPVHQVVARTA